jgi:hypothetical protein
MRPVYTLEMGDSKRRSPSIAPEGQVAVDGAIRFYSGLRRGQLRATDLDRLCDLQMVPSSEIHLILVTLS